MKKEIGSIFPLSDSDLRQAKASLLELPEERLYYSLCREALYDIAKSLMVSNGTVLIPAYTCQTVITPFEEAGWRCEYYSIHKNLRINTESLIDSENKYNPSIIVVHPYYGMDFSDAEVSTLTKLKEEGIEIVLDLTQCIFSLKQYSFASFVVASYRKWMPVPDGGYLINHCNRVSISQPLHENAEFTEREVAAMYLRGQYFGNGEQRTKAISIRLSKAADHIAESNIAPHRMSQVAYYFLQRENMVNNQKKRFENYAFLDNNIRETERVSKVCKDTNEVTSAPLYFTIYVEDRSALQCLLAQNAIYAPVLWPVEDERVLIDDHVKYIFSHLLAIPCDQRYDENDMQRVAEIINNY